MMKSHSHRIEVRSTYANERSRGDYINRTYKKNLNPEIEANYEDEPYNFNQKGQHRQNGGNVIWKKTGPKLFQTPRNKYNISSAKIAQSEVNLRHSGDNFYRNRSGNAQDFIARNDNHNTKAYRKPNKKYGKFLHNKGMGIRTMNRPSSPRMYRNEESYKSLQGEMDQKPSGSPKSMRPALYLNKYQDDCLYMNLEEEYLHRVSKRQGKTTNVSINRSMYNFK